MRNDSEKNVGTLYGIGIGPGDPGLITVKGMELIKRTADAGGRIYVPEGKFQNGSLAKSILKHSGTDVNAWVELEFPMTTDKTELRNKWKEAAGIISPFLLNGNDAVFLTLGDPSVYSTWIYLRRELMESNPEIDCVTIPGIQTANAAAAAHNISLLEGKEKLALLPAPDNPEELKPLLKLFDTIVLYKAGRRFPALKDFLIAEGLASSSWYTERAGLPEELLSDNLESLPDTASGYLSTIIIKPGNKQRGVNS